MHGVKKRIDILSFNFSCESRVVCISYVNFEQSSSHDTFSLATQYGLSWNTNKSVPKQKKEGILAHFVPIGSFFTDPISHRLPHRSHYQDDFVTFQCKIQACHVLWHQSKAHFCTLCWEGFSH